MVSCGAPTCWVNIDILWLAFVELQQSMACIGFEGAVPERHGSVTSTYTFSRKYPSLYTGLHVVYPDRGIFVARSYFSIGLTPVAPQSPDFSNSVNPRVNQAFHTYSVLNLCRRFVLCVCKCGSTKRCDWMSGTPVLHCASPSFVFSPKVGYPIWGFLWFSSRSTLPCVSLDIICCCIKCTVARTSLHELRSKLYTWDCQVG